MSNKQSFKKQTGITGRIPVESATPLNLLHDHRLRKRLAIFIGLFAFLLYIQTAGYDYTLDDTASITKNKFVTQGIGGIPEIIRSDYWAGYSEKLRGHQYRPASLVMLAVEWEFFPANPAVGHFMNLLLFALCCSLLFLLLTKLFREQAPWMPLAAVLLFAAHPIHTEVVNNIKSRDELLCLFFALLSALLVLRFLNRHSITSLVLACACFLLSMLSKETGISFLVILPLMVYFFRDQKKLLLISVSLAAMAGLYLLVRSQVIAGIEPGNLQLIDNSLTGATTTAGRYATAFYILLKYLGLLLVPHPLSYDYSFSTIPLKTFGDPEAIMGLLVYGAIFVYALTRFKKKDPLAFAILFFLITLAPASNLFLLIGSPMAERFLFIPSIGFCLGFAILLYRLAGKLFPAGKGRPVFTMPLAFKAVLLIITGLYSIKTFIRSADWQNNASLFAKDVTSSPNSARTHYNYGVSILHDQYYAEQDPVIKKQLLRQSAFELEKALAIYPAYEDAHNSLGFVYLKSGELAKAITHFDYYLQTNAGAGEVYNNKGSALMGLGQFDAAIPVLQRAVQLNSSDSAAYKNLGRCQVNLQQYGEAVQSFSRCLALDPSSAENNRFVGMAYQLAGDSARGRTFLEKAAQMQ